MYHSLLTRKYLTSKIMPLLAALAVVLCTGMVIVVWSVMGGFLSHLVNSGRVLIGDVIVEWPNSGFPYYEDLIARLEADPEIEAAAPAITTFSLVVMPDGRKEVVLIRGIDGKSFARVTKYDESLWWKPIDTPVRKDVDRKDQRLEPRNRPLLTEILENGRTLSRVDPATGLRVAALVPGVEVTGFNYRDAGGFFVPQGRLRSLGSSGEEVFVREFLPDSTATLTLNLLPVDASGNILEHVSRAVPVANEFHTGLYEMDHKTALFNLAEMQRLLKMDESKRVERLPGGPVAQLAPDGKTEIWADQFKVVGVEPARVTTVYVRGKGEQVDANKLKKRVAEIYEKFAVAHPGEVPSAGTIDVRTWRDQNRTMIEAVENETGLVLFLFGFISLTAVFLVLAIFWSMVAEKTKDIGILRALGASRTGVAWVWIRYGLVIGVVGALGGGVLSYFIVTYINEIHDWLSTGFLHITIWNPRVYYFSVIPAQFKWFDASIVVVAGVLSSGLGALVPAMRAARMDPVRAIRFE